LFLPVLRALVSGKILAKFGGRLRVCISGGAALSKTISKTFIGLGLNILQGYGLTEHSPVISVNRMRNNDPESVGPALPGIETKLAENGELLVRSPSVMMGYLNNIDATEEVIDEEGWLHTGDKCEIRDKRIYITGRSKEIIVMSNGEKVPPVDMEMAILEDPLFEQAMIIGESRAFLSALLVLNPESWAHLASSNRLDPLDTSLDKQVKLVKERIEQQLSEFPGYAQIHQITICEEPWTIDNAMLTPTLKLRRKQITAKYHNQIEFMYDGH
jgi:long-chain acyl-CoA synthetase